MRRTSALLAVGLVLTMMLPTWARAQGPAPALDENRLLGMWFEAARLPNRFEKNCAANAVNLVARAEKERQLRWLWVCTDKDGNTSTHQMLARSTKEKQGTYKMTYLFVLHRTYRVVALAEDNSWMMLGTPNRKSLWLYTTKPTVDAEALASMKSKATAAGYNVSRLISQPQSNPPKSPRNVNGSATVL